MGKPKSRSSMCWILCSSYPNAVRQSGVWTAVAQPMRAPPQTAVQTNCRSLATLGVHMFSIQLGAMSCNS